MKKYGVYLLLLSVVIPEMVHSRPPDVSARTSLQKPQRAGGRLVGRGLPGRIARSRGPAGVIARGGYCAPAIQQIRGLLVLDMGPVGPGEQVTIDVPSDVQGLSISQLALRGTRNALIAPRVGSLMPDYQIDNEARDLSVALAPAGGNVQVQGPRAQGANTRTVRGRTVTFECKSDFNSPLFGQRVHVPLEAIDCEDIPGIAVTHFDAAGNQTRVVIH